MHLITDNASTCTALYIFFDLRPDRRRVRATATTLEAFCELDSGPPPVHLSGRAAISSTSTGLRRDAVSTTSARARNSITSLCIAIVDLHCKEGAPCIFLSLSQRLSGSPPMIGSQDHPNSSLRRRVWWQHLHLSFVRLIASRKPRAKVIVPVNILPDEGVSSNFLSASQHQRLYVTITSNAIAQTPFGPSARTIDILESPQMISSTLLRRAERLFRVRCARGRPARPPPPSGWCDRSQHLAC